MLGVHLSADWECGVKPEGKRSSMRQEENQNSSVLKAKNVPRVKVNCVKC
jgi:hypothetical protein